MARLRTSVFAIPLLALAQPATASEPSGLRHVSCSVVRLYVARYSEAAAETWARGKGASDAEIEAARSCLPRSTLHASWIK